MLSSRCFRPKNGLQQDNPTANLTVNEKQQLFDPAPLPEEVEMQESEKVVRALWNAFDRRDFAAAGALLSAEFICEWPQSGERIRGRENFVAVNAHYPGEWRIRVLRVLVSGGEVATEVEATWGEQRAAAVSFFSVREGCIWHLREFWPEPFPAPDWRAAWVERM